MSRHRADLESAEVGEAVAVMATPAGRLAARVIDTVLLGVLLVGAATLLMPDSGWLPRAVFVVLGLAVLDAFCVAVTGSTPGKMLLGIHLVDARTGAAPTPEAAVARTALGLVITPLFVALSVLLVDERTRRGWHDLVSGTVVVLRPEEL